jgi:S1-C subfamily serine protease
VTESIEVFRGEESAVLSNPPEFLLGSVIPVLFQPTESALLAGAQVEGHGTAFCVAVLANGQAVYVTARHVVEPFGRTYGLPLVFLPGRRERTHFVGVHVNAITVADAYNDVALLRFDATVAPEPVAVDLLRPLRLALRRAVVGEMTLALGYPGQAIDATAAPVTLHREFRGSQGRVEEVHDLKRDAALSTFPSFRTGALYMPGMSGGPVFGEDGAVIGVVSHGMTNSEAGSPCGYAASIACCAELAVDLRPDDADEREFPFQELIDLGAVTAPTGAVTLQRTEDGLRLEWPASPIAASAVETAVPTP